MPLSCYLFFFLGVVLPCWPGAKSLASPGDFCFWPGAKRFASPGSVCRWPGANCFDDDDPFVSAEADASASANSAQMTAMLRMRCSPMRVEVLEQTFTVVFSSSLRLAEELVCFFLIRLI